MTHFSRFYGWVAPETENDQGKKEKCTVILCGVYFFVLFDHTRIYPKTMAAHYKYLTFSYLPSQWARRQHPRPPLPLDRKSAQNNKGKEMKERSITTKQIGQKGKEPHTRRTLSARQKETQTGLNIEVLHTIPYLWSSEQRRVAGVAGGCAGIKVKQRGIEVSNGGRPLHRRLKSVVVFYAKM